MKKTTKLGVICLGITTLLTTTAFNLKNGSDVRIDKYNSSSSCNSLNKSANGTKTAYTQSAHDQTAPGTCSGCHSAGSATPVITITSSPAFGAGNTYVPGTTYTMTYAVTGYPKFGFDLEMNDGNTTTSMGAGTLSAGTNSRYTALPYGSYPANISQSAAITTGSVATFTWVAPSIGTTVYLFSNGLGVNGNGSDGSGDKEAFKNMVLTPAGGSAGVETVTLNNEVKLFPNPSQGEATINYTLNTESRIIIDITDLNGKLISNQVNEKAESGQYSKKLDLRNIEKGVYFVHLKSNGKEINKKLIID